MEQLFKQQRKIRKEQLEQIKDKEIIEREFLLNFFNELPINDLKRLVNFKIIDADNKELWEDEKNREYLYQLQHENCIVYRCEMYLDNGIDDLSLGQI